MGSSVSFDWERYWEDPDEETLATMREAGTRMADRIERYFETVPETLADVGCGPAFALFELAERYPDREFVGYDLARTVVDRNRSRASDRGLDNLTFRRGSLPELDVDRSFDCVLCIATLHYVAAIDRAIEALLALVAPGGTLVFNYPNRHTQRLYRESDETDPDRFELVLRGENLLTYDRIARITGRQPRSFWKAVDEDDWRSLGQTNPCVVIEK